MADAWNPTAIEIGRDSSRACWPASLVELESPRPQREMLSQNFTLRNDTWGWSLASTSMSTRTCTHTYTYTCSLPHTQYTLHIHIWISHPYMSEVDECVFFFKEKDEDVQWARTLIIWLKKELEMPNTPSICLFPLCCFSLFATPTACFAVWHYCVDPP